MISLLFCIYIFSVYLDKMKVTELSVHEFLLACGVQRKHITNSIFKSGRYIHALLKLHIILVKYSLYEIVHFETKI